MKKRENTARLHVDRLLDLLLVTRVVRQYERENMPINADEVTPNTYVGFRKTFGGRTENESALISYYCAFGAGNRHHHGTRG